MLAPKCRTMHVSLNAAKKYQIRSQRVGLDVKRHSVEILDMIIGSHPVLSHPVIKHLISYQSFRDESHGVCVVVVVHRRQWASISPRPTLSQNLLSLQTRPTPDLSSHRLLASVFSRHCRSHTLPTHLRRPSFTRSLSTALVFATKAGATLA